MIVRIQGEGQWELSGAQIDELDRIDNQLLDMIDLHDESQFVALFGKMLEYVRANGRPLPTEEIVESNVILPPADATMADVRRLFAEEGLVKP